MPDETSPKPLLDKLGVKSGMAMAALGFVDLAWTEGQPFDRSLVADARYDLIVVRVDEAASLAGLRHVKQAVAEKGMFWIVYPKGVRVIIQSQVMFAGNAEGWTDVKVCRFSETHTALKFLRRRKPAV